MYSYRFVDDERWRQRCARGCDDAGVVKPEKLPNALEIANAICDQWVALDVHARNAAIVRLRAALRAVRGES